MKRILTTLLAASLFLGCATDRGGLEPAANVVTGSGSRVVGPADSNFAREACQAGVAEVEIGKLAARNTKNADVRALARRIASDHSQAEKELAQLFARKGLPPEREMAPPFRTSLDRLAALKGREFDHAFKEQVIEDHRSAIDLFEKQADQGTDPDLKAFAQRHLPHLREHLAAAERLEVHLNSRNSADPTAIDVIGNPAARGLGTPR